MDKYVCPTCGWIYDPEQGDMFTGIPEGTAFAELSEDWCCPICQTGKGMFGPEAGSDKGE